MSLSTYGDDQLPGNICGYSVTKRLGQGGMAEVFKAVRSGAAGFERPVCLKVILPHLSRDEEFRELFVREARTAGKLNHSNLVQVFDCVRQGQLLALVMELVEGCDLKALIRALHKKESTMPLDLVEHIGGEVLNGLWYAHTHRVVHRDVSPHNILISSSGEVKLTDFGIAKAMESHATKTGQFKGKMAYMSPEQARGQPVDERTDLYSLGLVLYELVSGERFFKASTANELFGVVANARRPTIEGIPDELSSAIEGLLEPEPHERPRTAQEALAAFPRLGRMGPHGKLGLAELIEPILAERESVPDQVVDTPSPQENMTGTEVLSGLGAPGIDERLERPVVRSRPDVPTATRVGSVKDAIGAIPTERDLPPVDDVSAEWDVPEDTARHRSPVWHVVAIIIAISLVFGLIGVMGGLLGADLFDHEDPPARPAEPSVSAYDAGGSSDVSYRPLVSGDASTPRETSGEPGTSVVATSGDESPDEVVSSPPETTSPLQPPHPRPDSGARKALPHQPTSIDRRPDKAPTYQTGAGHNPFHKK